MPNPIERRHAARWSFMLCRFEDPKPADPPKADPPAADPPKADPPKADPPKPTDPNAGKTAEQLLADAQAEAEKWKGLSKKHEDQAKANATKAKRFDEAEAANQSELEKATARAEAAEKAAAQRSKTAVRSEVRALADEFADRDDAIVNLAADEGGLERFVDDAGEIDVEAIKTALAAKLEKKPHLKKSTTPTPPRQDPGLGPRGGGDPVDYRKAEKTEFAGELAKHGLRPRST